MSKRNKIIVSIVGITIVLLALLGITYAYYLTRIEGNTNTNSISVTTANLKLTYNDGDGSIIGSGKTLIPDNDNPVGTKVFTVTNNGNEKVEDYALIIENFAVKYHSGANQGKVTSLVNGDDGNPDMKLSITCKSYKNYSTTKVETGTCNGMDGFLPEKSDILLINSIDKEITHEYTAVLTYLEDGTDQSDDMNKTIEGKFNIIDTKNTVDITGTVQNYTKGDIVTINSEYKESVIYMDGTYKFIGVKPDVHTIKVVGSSTTEVGKVSIKGGTTASTTGNATVDGTTIPEVTITDESRILTVNLKEGIEISALKDYNPYSNNGENRLNYMLINSALNISDVDNKLGYAKYTPNPLTPPGKNPSGFKFSTKTTSTSGEIYIYNGLDTRITYGTGYVFDESRRTFSLTGVQTAPLEDVYLNLEGKYFSGESDIGYSEYMATENLSSIVKANGEYELENPSQFITRSTIFYDEITKVTTEAIEEATLSSTKDDYGKSYYFRGNVSNNYVNFSGMCWRVVRVQGNGTIKLILQDSLNECDSEDYSSENNKLYYTYTTNDGRSGLYVKYSENTSFNYANSNIALFLDRWLNGGATSGIGIVASYSLPETFEKQIDDSKLATTEWCNDISESDEKIYIYNHEIVDSSYGDATIINAYNAYNRLYNEASINPTLKCDITGTNNTKSLKYTSKIGLLTGDEAAFSGIKFYYDEGGTISTNALTNNSYLGSSIITMTLISNGYVAADNKTYHITLPTSVRPAIVLNSNVTATTNAVGEPGTQNNPYVVS